VKRSTVLAGLLAVFSAGAVCGVFACDSTPSTAEALNSTSATDTSQADGGACVAASADGGSALMTTALRDAEIVQLLMVANEGEIALGELAKQQARQPEVLAFADRMVTEHTAANQRLSLLASQVRTNTATPAMPNAIVERLREEAQQVADVLRGQSDASFDLAYMDSQLAIHSKLLFLLDTLATSQVTAVDLRSEVIEIRRASQDHLQAALPIQSNLTPTF
jgi:putative membrane protein